MVCQHMQCVLQRCSIPIIEAKLAFVFETSTISFKTYNAFFIEIQLPPLWNEHHLFEGKVFLTQIKIESPASFESCTIS